MIFLELIHLAAAPPQPGPDVGTQILIAALGAGSLGAIVAAVITGLFSKKKLGSEATEIITRAASGVVTDLREELDRSKKARQDDRIEFRSMLARERADHEAEMTEVRRVLQLHVAWDTIAIAKMAEFGVDLPEAPPLLPPSFGSRFRHEE
jgi:hypothetical protein